MPMVFRFLSALALVCAATAARAEIRVVASIKPLHSLVASVMDGIARPSLLVEGAASPHTYALKPSQAAELARADVVFWIGHELEAFLEKPLETIGSDAAIVALSETAGLVMLETRAGGLFEAHEADAHDHGGHDAHFWLDPRNAIAMVTAIEAALSRADPVHAARYAGNALALRARLTTLQDAIAARLTPVRGKPYIVFHDAFQYFEKRFGVPAAGAVTINPESPPGAERIAAIRERIGSAGAACVFSEPQFEPKYIAVIVEGTDARTGVLDPEGADLPDGPDLYFRLLENIAGSLAGCLGQD